MPISVTCPECAYRFHVDKAYAGRPGRCPECDAVIQVPAADSLVEDFSEDDVEEFPTSYRRRPEEPPPLRDDARERAPFNPGPRIEKWKKVAAGFRNLAIAAGLIGIDTAIRGAFNLANGLPKEEDEMTSAQKALMVGNALFTALAIILWAIGRIGLVKTPFLPAAVSAKSSGVLAAMTAIPGVLGVGMAVGGIVIAADNLMAGMALIQLGGCGICLFGLGWVVSEIVGLIAQIRMMSGLEETGAARWAKFHLTALLLMVTLGTVGFCGLVLALSAEMQQQQQQQANNPPPAGKAKGKGKANANANNPPPPQFNPEDHKEVVTAAIVIVAGGTIGFSLVCVFSFLAAQGAIRREIARLSGDHDGHAHEY